MVRFQYAQRCASRSVQYFNILSGGTLNGVLPVRCGTLTFYRVVLYTYIERPPFWFQVGQHNRNGTKNFRCPIVVL